MLFAIICEDKPNSLELRKATRPEHVDFLNGLGETLSFAGPFLNDEEAPCGSLVVVEARDKAEAQEIAGRDPYARAGLFETVTVRPWVWAIKKPADA
ncbi:YciI-like protein [Fulvimarina sp. 2208YS6-2-32]|uniref:YciI-like protein n=1 Tax=Fulvimarina uroteuthidis TaxID=3098149 RepID=A0ABU5HZ64_9HYPH|nr:YciI-like protein [Fulvimarina sp. 2208YS6-2-32]MDY8108420.1 YciI-like protein [Fulvimarina sp. 2208YS6-2-32]